MVKICILDYGLGNIQSLNNALNKIGYEAEFYTDKNKSNYDLIFIPGIGSYFKASNLLLQKKYLNFLNKRHKNAKLFGICLGMQMFSTYGEEFGKSKGLNYVPSKTIKFTDKSNKLILPFVGYHKVEFKKLKKYFFLKEFNNKKFYFVHSYHVIPEKKSNILSLTKQQGVTYCSSIIGDRYLGTQFHPEKSGELGLEFLKKVIKKII